MSVAPVVHVLVGRPAHDAPVDRRIPEQHADLLAGWEGLVQGSDLTQHAFVHRCRPDTGHHCGVLPNLPQLITRDPFACHVAIGDVLIPGIAELDDEVVDGADKSWVPHERGQELFRSAGPVARLAKPHQGETIERLGEVIRRWLH